MEMQPSQQYFYRKENPFGLTEYIDNIKDNCTVSEGMFILGHGLNPGV
jgi:hypothetical protein